MNKLLFANFTRLKKNKIFWLFTIFVVVFALFNAVVGIINIEISTMQGISFDELYFRAVPTVGFFILIFTSFFIGTEYSDGTLRNKIITGKTRTHIYLSNLVTTIMLFFMFMIIWTTITFIAMPTVGDFNIGFPNAMIYTVIMMFIITIFSAIFTFNAMLCSNKALALLVSIVILLGMLMISSSINNVLLQPEITEGYYFQTVDGVTKMIKGEPTPNPYYLEEGILRSIYEYISEFFPIGQTSKIVLLEVMKPIKMIAFSLVNTIIITICGVFLFNKKDLK